MHHPNPGVAHKCETVQHAIEHAVEDHVPGQGQGCDGQGRHAHFQHRLVHDPGEQRGADQHRQQFETDGLENTFSDGFVGVHDQTPE
ncbi:hypothetical protein D3C85_1787990 [compost metagenome]